MDGNNLQERDIRTLVRDEQTEWQGVTSGVGTSNVLNLQK